MKMKFVIAAVLGMYAFDALAGEELQKTFQVYNIVPADNDIEIVLPSGEKAPIHIEAGSSPEASDAIAVLKYSVYISTRDLASPPKGRSTIYFIGRITGELPSIKATKNTEGVPKRLRFLLVGWYMEVPYIEYPQLPPDQMGKWKPIVRHSLEATDFKKPSVFKNVHYDKEHRVYWVGINPFEIKLQ
jgi:hypothetical protein